MYLQVCNLDSNKKVGGGIGGRAQAQLLHNMHLVNI